MKTNQMKKETGGVSAAGLVPRKRCRSQLRRIDGWPLKIKQTIEQMYLEQRSYREIIEALKKANYQICMSALQKWCCANLAGQSLSVPMMNGPDRGQISDNTTDDHLRHYTNAKNRVGQTLPQSTDTTNTMPVVTQRTRVYKFNKNKDCQTARKTYTIKHVHNVYPELPQANVHQWIEKGFIVCHARMRGSRRLNVFDVDQVIYVGVILEMSRLGMLDQELNAKIIEPIDTSTKDLEYTLTEPAKIIQVFRDYKWNACLVGTYAATTARFTASRNRLVSQQLSLTLHHHASLIDRLPFGGGHRGGTCRRSFAVLNLKAIADRAMTALATASKVYRSHQKHAAIDAAPAQEKPTASTPIDKRAITRFAVLDRISDEHRAKAREWKRWGYSGKTIADKLHVLDPKIKISGWAVNTWCKKNGIKNARHGETLHQKKQPKPTKLSVMMAKEGLSSTDVAEITGIHCRTVEKVMYGRYEHNGPTVSAALADLFGAEWTLAKLMEPEE